MKRKRNDDEDFIVNEEEFEDEEEEEENEEQPLKKRRVEDDEEEDDDEDDEKESKGPEDGIIEKIVLENFMCHRKLTVELGTHINIVSGANGSGKSAIMTALQICLGSRKTRSATSLSSFIRTGEEACFVNVSLRNKGADAFKPDIYGNTITVERQIRRLSGGGYKIKDCDNRVVSRKKAELDLILSHFNIHVNNPCIVMDQDCAKKFLAKAKGKEKYEFFLEASQLKSMLNDFTNITGNKLLMAKTIDNKQLLLQKDKDHLDKLEEDVKITSQINTLESQKDLINNKIHWTYVKACENILERIENKYNEEKEKLDGCQGDLSKVETELKEKEEKDKEISSQLDEKTRRKREIRGEITEVTHDLKLILKKKSKIESKIGDHKRTIKNAQKVIRKTEKEIEDVRNRKDDDIVEDKENLVNRIKNMQQKISDYKRQQKDRLIYFGDQMIKLIRMINENARRFSKFPIGPIGIYINVTEAKWAAGVEATLKRAMNSFIVENQKDSDFIRRLCERSRLRRPVVLIYKFETSKYRLHRDRLPDRKYESILDVLKVDTSLADKNKFRYDRNILEPTILNLLVDQFKIEKTILFKGREAAMKEVFPNFPRNVKKCVTETGTELSMKGTSEITITKFHKNEFLGTGDVQNLINDLVKEIKTIQNGEEKDNTKLLREVSHKKREIKKKLDILKGRVRKSKKNIFKLGKVVSKLKEELENIEPEEEDDKEEEIKELQDNIENARNDIAKENIKIDKLKNEIDQIPNEKCGYDEKLEKFEKEMDMVNNELSDLQDQAEEQNRVLYQAKHMLNTTRKGVVKHQKNCTLLEEKKNEKQSELETLIESAKKHSEERVESKNTIEELKEEKLKFERMIGRKTGELRGRTVLEIESEFNDCKGKYNDTSRFLKTSGKNLESVKKGLNKRFNTWKKIRGSYSQMSSIGFNDSMSQKGHSGHLEFDFDKGTLDTIVRLSKAESRKVTDAKSLSGGERSFSTVALICGLWSVVESPFRIFDEVDIYMDSVYRKKALDLLIDIANSKDHLRRQLILITPQAVDGIKKKYPTVKIHKLKDPERTGDGMIQTTITRFTSQNTIN